MSPDPSALADLQLFSKQFGLPVPTPSNFQVVFASGVQPARDLGWELEEALDIEYAHAMAPNATLYLVEAASDSLSSLLAAVDKASQLVAKAGGGQVSMSWGSAEFSGQTSFDSHFLTQNVVYFASSGDSQARVGLQPQQMSSRLAVSASRVRCRLSASYILHHGVKRAVASAVLCPVHPIKRALPRLSGLCVPFRISPPTPIRKRGPGCMTAAMAAGISLAEPVLRHRPSQALPMRRIPSRPRRMRN